MIEFEKPDIQCLEVDEKRNYSKFVCEPLERGYGVTIGNSLRRILLSSLPGTAITSIKIEGVLHEFSTIPNVVEDVPELIVNLKDVRLKMDGNEERVIRIDAKEGEVTAGDIITDGVVDVLNKDLKVMDSTATAMCRDNNIPLLVFGIADPENIVRAVKGEKIGTIVS